MANGNDPTYRRVPYWVRVRLKRLGNLCAHGCASVAHAAHAEIGRIHRKYRLSRPARVRAWLGGVAKAGVRKVTPAQLHGPLRVKAAQANTPRQARAADIPLADLPKRSFTPEHGFGQTKQQLKERARGSGHQQRGAPAAVDPGLEHDLAAVQLRTVENLRREQDGDVRAQRSQPARKPDAMQQATENMRRQHAQPAPQPARSPGRTGPQPQARESETQKAVREISNTFAKYYPDVQPMPERGRGQGSGRKDAAPAANVPAPPGHPESVRKAAEDREKGRWAGLRSRLAPEHTTRSRTRSA